MLLWALGIGGVVLIVFEYLFSLKKKVSLDATYVSQTPDSITVVSAHEEVVSSHVDIHSLSYAKATLIGVAQAVAVIPGVSRSAATILGGLGAGMSRAAIVEFSFLLAVPTIGAATVLDLYKNSGLFSVSQIGVLSVGFIASFVTALFGIRFLLRIIRRRSFVGFGVYRIIIALGCAIVLISL